MMKLKKCRVWGPHLIIIFSIVLPFFVTTDWEFFVDLINFVIKMCKKINTGILTTHHFFKNKMKIFHVRK